MVHFALSAPCLLLAIGLLLYAESVAGRPTLNRRKRQVATSFNSGAKTNNGGNNFGFANSGFNSIFDNENNVFNNGIFDNTFGLSSGDDIFGGSGGFGFDNNFFAPKTTGTNGVVNTGTGAGVKGGVKGGVNGGVKGGVNGGANNGGAVAPTTDMTFTTDVMMTTRRRGRNKPVKNTADPYPVDQNSGRGRTTGSFVTDYPPMVTSAGGENRYGEITTDYPGNDFTTAGNTVRQRGNNPAPQRTYYTRPPGQQPYTRPPGQAPYTRPNSGSSRVRTTPRTVIRVTNPPRVNTRPPRVNTQPPVVITQPPVVQTNAPPVDPAGVTESTSSTSTWPSTSSTSSSSSTTTPSSKG